MCGFVGYITNNLNENEHLVIKMAQTLEHRGPDSFGFYTNSKGNVFMGHTRLSIIDLKKSGDQPLISNSKRFVIVFNGEIYNHKLLKKELLNDNNIEWKGTSDTEILINCIEYWDAVFIFLVTFSRCDTSQNISTIIQHLPGMKSSFFARNTLDNQLSIVIY